MITQFIMCFFMFVLTAFTCLQMEMFMYLTPILFCKWETLLPGFFFIPNLVRLCFRYKSKPVAVKILQPARTSEVSADRKEKFQREVTLLSKVKHANIVNVLYFVTLKIVCVINICIFNWIYRTFFLYVKYFCILKFF